jgi:hypothetical protein
MGGHVMDSAKAHMQHSSSHQQTTPDGLRYVNRPALDARDSLAYTGLRSCLLCGHLKPASQLKARRLFGTNHLVCAEKCGRR